MSVPPPPSPPPPAGARDPMTPEGRLGPVTPEHRASGPPSQAQPLLRQEAKGEEEEGEETGVPGASRTGTAEQRRRGWGEAAEAPAAEEGQVEAGGAAAAGSGSPAGGAGGGRGDWRRLLAWLRRRRPQCCPCAAPLPRSAAHCCHGGTKMAALAYNLGKREINHYFSVRSAKVLALAAVLLLAACHLASRRYRGERALPLPGRGRRRRGEWRPPPAPNTRPRPRGRPRARPAGEAAPPRAPRCPPQRAPAWPATVRGPVVLGAPSRPCWGRGRHAGPGRRSSRGPGSSARRPGGHAPGTGPACGRSDRRPSGASPGRSKAKASLHGGASVRSGGQRFCALGVRLFSLCLIRSLPCNSRTELLLDSGKGRPVFLWHWG